MDDRHVDPETGEIMAAVGPAQSLMQRYEDALDALNVLRAELATEREAILAPVKPALDQLDAHYAGLIEDAEAELKAQLDALKQAVLEGAASVKGNRVQAVYVSGRTTWDTRRLERYAEDHPELADFRKTGAPSVTLRVNG